MNKPPVIVRPEPGHPSQGGRVLPKPEPIKEPGRIIDSRRGGTDKDLRTPIVGPDHRLITQKPLANKYNRVIPPQGKHGGALRDRKVEDNIRHAHKHWDHRDHDVHWHEWNGHRICHNYDERGFHWWGFYMADAFFWTRYWNDQYWWYDPYWHRWCYMRDDRWWWQDPDRPEIVYVYQDDSYYRYEEGSGGVVLNPDPTPPVEAPPAEPAPAPDSKAFYSLDGTRTVQVFGDAKDAYLYDTADPPAFEPKWLGSGVADVRFQSDDQQQLVGIQTIMADGSVNAFDKDGNPQAAEQPAPEPLPAPGSGDGASASPVGQSLRRSAAFDALKAGSFGW